MELPTEWQDAPRKRREHSKASGGASTTSAPKRARVDESRSLEALGYEICREILAAKDTRHAEMSFDSVLSTVPYKDILQNLYGGRCETAAHFNDVPVLTRLYEESFMREPIHISERPCAMGRECECMKIDPHNAFIGVEFALQVESTTGPHMCVLCSRKTTQKLFYDLIYNNAPAAGQIQRYGVMSNVENEYKVEYCLIMPPQVRQSMFCICMTHGNVCMPTQGPVHCMPYPTVVHCRNNYTVQTRACVRYLVQKPEMVFRLPLSSKV